MKILSHNSERFYEEYSSRLRILMERVDYLKLDDSQEHSNEEMHAFYTSLSQWEKYYPKLWFPNLDKKKIQQVQRDIESVIWDLQNMPDSPEKTLFFIVVKRLQARIQSLVLIQKSWWVTEKEKEEYQKLNHEIHWDTPDWLFIHILWDIQKRINEDMLSGDDELKELALTLNEFIPSPGKKVSVKVWNISQSLEENIQNHISRAIKDLDIDWEKKYTDEEMKTLFESALKNLWIPGWECIIVQSNKTALSVSATQKQVRIPAWKKISGKEIQKKIAHEICVHAFRSFTWENSSFSLLWVGIWNYTETEEGMAKLYDSIDENQGNILPTEDKILSIWLVLGLDGKPRDFIGLFKVVDAHYRWELKRTNKTLKETTIQKNIWNRCVRIFKGINTQTKWVCSTKDVLYRKGYIDLLDFLETIPEDKASTILDFLFQGKFSLFDTETLTALEKITGSIPESVRELLE